MTTIRPADNAADIDAVADLIAHSFDHLDANHYLIPDPARRLDGMRGFFHILTEHAATGAGQVLLTGDGNAAAVWFDRTTEPTEPADYAARIDKAAGEYVPRFDALDELFEAHHPADPHWHLAFIAVHPDHWGKGLGSDLMRHTHSRLDAQGVPAYLEGTNPENCRVYRRHGYTDMDPFAIVLGDDTGGSATFYRMWRPAGAPETATRD